jgi:hypothetical protein
MRVLRSSRLVAVALPPLAMAGGNACGVTHRGTGRRER